MLRTGRERDGMADVHRHQTRIGSYCSKSKPNWKRRHQKKKRRAGRFRPAFSGYCDLRRDYGVVLVPMYGATPGVQPATLGGQTGVPPAGPIVVPAAGDGEQPLPSHAASKSTE